MTNRKEPTALSTMVRVSLLLFLVQAARWLLTGWLCGAAHGNAVLERVTGILSLVTIGSLLLVLARYARVHLSVFPAFTSNKDRILYISASAAVLLILLAAPVKAGDYSPAPLLGFVYAAVMLPIFEELLFRGYVWGRLHARFTPELTVCMISAVLFAVWKAGYTDALLANTALSTADIVMTVLTNMALALMVGLITGLARLITKNCVPGMLIHIVLAVVLY
ncbi:MAG: lysostaphin resistance A-like protein [Acetanaerobacterium sp.]